LRAARVRTRSGARKVRARFDDHVRFVGAMVSSPRRTGAVAPTARETADLMAAHIDLASGLPVLELGPGTGAVTRAIIGRGVPPARLWAVEFSPRFCRHLRSAWPAMHVIEGDAFDLDAALGPDGPDRFDCVISGLPLLNFEPAMRVRLMKGALARLAPGRPFVQFSYGVRPPIAAPDASIRVECSRWVLRNLPPARVWTYVRKD
jgi:phosphatidylethanolamine/phosphatidyl-N-methylethanolamine N-methyltransferase